MEKKTKKLEKLVDKCTLRIEKKKKKKNITPDSRLRTGKKKKKKKKKMHQYCFTELLIYICINSILN